VRGTLIAGVKDHLLPDGRPGTSLGRPSNSLFRVLHGAGLAHGRDLDLPGVLELLLDLLGDVASHDLRREVVDVVGPHHFVHECRLTP
jgi:hypothetical protein